MFRTVLTKSLAALALLSLVACGPSEVVSGEAKFRLTQNGVTGQYDKASYSRGQIEFLLANVCKTSELASFNEAYSENVVSFSGTCVGELLGGGGGFIKKTSQNQAQMVFTYRDPVSGQYFQPQANFQLTQSGGRKI